MKKSIVILCAMILIHGVGRVAGAALTTIGTASYLGSNYNLIYEDDQHLIWLDYLKTPDDWYTQMSWADGLNSPGMLTYNLYPGIKVTWGSDWRLQITDESVVNLNGSSYGYQGPDETGHYSYWAGYNMTHSEMGHLYYESLMNKGYVATDGTEPQPGWGLKYTCPFNNLKTGYYYWSGTEYSPDTNAAWHFNLSDGYQGGGGKDFNFPVLAVRDGDVVLFDPLKMDTMSPTGAVHAYPNVIVPNKKLVTITLDGYVMDELSIARDGTGTGIGVSSAYLTVDEKTIILRESTDTTPWDGRFSVTIQVQAKKGAVYKVELNASDTKPIEDGGPNFGLVDLTFIRVK